MLRRSPRAALLWAAALIVALVTAATVVNTLSSLRHQDRTFGRVHTMLVVRRDLAIGTRVTQTDLDTRTLRGEPPELGTLTRARDAVNRVVRVPLLAGTAVTARHLTVSRRPGLGGVVPDGRRAFRVVVEHALRPAAGDFVDILATFDPAVLGDDQDPTIVIAPAVTVLAVDGIADAGDSVGVTVLVTPTQASRLAFSAASGTLSLALAPTPADPAE